MALSFMLLRRLRRLMGSFMQRCNIRLLVLLLNRSKTFLPLLVPFLPPLKIAIHYQHIPLVGPALTCILVEPLFTTLFNNFRVAGVVFFPYTAINYHRLRTKRRNSNGYAFPILFFSLSFSCTWLFHHRNFFRSRPSLALNLGHSTAFIPLPSFLQLN